MPKLSRLSVTLLFLIATALGQTAPGSLVADIPFSFVVGGRTLPAGRYFLSSLGEKTLHIVDAQNRGTYILTFKIDDKSLVDSGKLIFNHYADNYFLEQVWGMSGLQGRQLFESSAEKEWGRKVGSKEVAVLRTTN